MYKKFYWDTILLLFLLSKQFEINEEYIISTSLFDKRDGFNFHITNFPFLSSSIPSSPAYDVFISQLNRYSRDCSTFECLFPLLIWTLLPNLTFYLIVRGFHITFATGAACQQRTLTPPDTWSCPIWDLQMFFCWDHWHSIIHFTTNSRLFTWFNFLPNLTPLIPGFDTTISCPFPWFDFLLNLTWLNIGFHWTFATGVAC